jgi:hypothetical protein
VLLRVIVFVLALIAEIYIDGLAFAGIPVPEIY